MIMRLFSWRETFVHLRISSFNERKCGSCIPRRAKRRITDITGTKISLPILKHFFQTGSSGLQFSFLNLVRDITYYDGSFIRNVILLKHANGISKF